MQFPPKTNAPVKGDVIGPVELVERIGVGGFGSVWRVRHLRTGETLALKILHPSLYEEVPGAGPSVVDRFLREARILQNIRHPGVVRILDVIEEPQKGLIAYLMELLEGRDLSTYALKTDLPSVLEIFARTARTLVAVHEKGLLHRDIKLTNIFVCNQLGEDGFPVVKLIDFGIAKDLETSSFAHRTAAGHYVGTLESMAPECYERLLGTEITLTPAVDQWSLGVSLYHAVSGRVPFKATNEAQSALIQLQLRICNEEPPPLGLLRHYGLAAVPDGLEAIVQRCLEKKPEDRYPTLAALADDLSNVFAEQTDENTAVSSWEPTSPTLVPSKETVDDGTDDIPAYDDRTSRTAQGALSESDEYAETAIDDPHALQTAVGTLRDAPNRPSTTEPRPTPPAKTTEAIDQGALERALAPTAQRPPKRASPPIVKTVPQLIAKPTRPVHTPGPPLVRPVSEASLASPRRRTWGLSLGWTMLLLVAAAALSFLVGLYG